MPPFLRKPGSQNFVTLITFMAGRQFFPASLAPEVDTECKKPFFTARFASS